MSPFEALSFFISFIHFTFFLFEDLTFIFSGFPFAVQLRTVQRQAEKRLSQTSS